MTPRAEILLVDAHVHYHGCFEAAQFFEGARRNFAAAATVLGHAAWMRGCLAFTESAWDHHFQAFREHANRLAPPRWRFEHTKEDFSLIANRDDGTSMIMLAGRQLVTADGLEVLAIGTAKEFADGLDTREAIAAVQDSGALAVLPWGFGKWWFKRGSLAEEIIDTAERKAFFVGDNGGRPTLSSQPSLFRRARQRGIRVLPGSDPLPFSSQSATVGSFGFVLAGHLDEHQPGESIKAAILKHDGEFQHFGRGESLISFCRQQIAMQIVKRRRST
jgi:hypothetical protein